MPPTQDKIYHPTKKGSRMVLVRKSFHKKSKFKGKQHSGNSKLEKNFVSASAKKLSGSSDPDGDLDVGLDSKFVILAFSSVFSHLEHILKCKKYDGNIRFSRKSGIGFGFKLENQCSCQHPSSVNSCTSTYKTYGFDFPPIRSWTQWHKFVLFHDLGLRFNQNLYYTACTNIAFSAECDE
ncbi:hypothetical protein HHI36_022250 [Cryptolaemus montrouzieri]|uniref:Uncharacterized protein n=1 Tax=Cryptolaemus montrouzieri TaxID=559131 RepID=A0ABD2MZI8_9CUCU